VAVDGGSLGLAAVGEELAPLVCASVLLADEARALMAALP
jgi:hypothetical protein